MWLFPGGTCNNERAHQHAVQFGSNVPEELRQLLFTPESGGLLIAVPRDRLETLLHLFAEAGESCWVIGEVVQGQGICVI